MIMYQIISQIVKIIHKDNRVYIIYLVRIKSIKLLSKTILIIILIHNLNKKSYREKILLLIFSNQVKNKKLLYQILMNK